MGTQHVGEVDADVHAVGTPVRHAGGCHLQFCESLSWTTGNRTQHVGEADVVVSARGAPVQRARLRDARHHRTLRAPRAVPVPLRHLRHAAGEVPSQACLHSLTVWKLLGTTAQTAAPALTSSRYE